jgi:MerR-like DNA binding protein
MARQKSRRRGVSKPSIPNRKIDPESPVVTSVELANILGVELEWVKNWFRRGVIERATIGGRQLRSRLFSKDEVYKAALIHELVKLGIAPSIAGEAVSGLWMKWQSVHAPNGENMYAALLTDKRTRDSVLFWQNQSNGALRQLPKSPAGEPATFDFPTQAFVVIPISEVIGEMTKRLARISRQ